MRTGVFEDVSVVDECRQDHSHDWEPASQRYSELRKVHLDTLADLAIRNFVEMRDHTGSSVFLFKKKVDSLLHRVFPRWYHPLYFMATFTRMPYADAVKRAKRQTWIVRAGLAIILMVLLWVLWRLVV